MRFNTVARALVGAAVMFSAATASAQTGFYGQSGIDYLQAKGDLQDLLSTTGNNNLNALTQGALPKSIDFGFVFGAATASGPAAVGGSSYYNALGNVINGFGVANIDFTFSQYINGFGADWVDIGTFGSPESVTYSLYDNMTLLGTVTQSWGPQSFGNLAFFGVFNATGFNRVVATVDTQGDYFEMDNITVGRAAVPEPSTLALTAAGLAGLFGVARRRRQA